MSYSKQSPKWNLIRERNPIWFHQSSMRFFNTRVYWQSLAPYREGFLFITREQYIPATYDLEPGKKLYSIRYAGPDGIETIGEFQEHDCYECAKDKLEHLQAVAEFAQAISAA